MELNASKPAIYWKNDMYVYYHVYDALVAIEQFYILWYSLFIA